MEKRKKSEKKSVCPINGVCDINGDVCDPVKKKIT